MFSELSEEKAKIMFIIVVVVFIVVLLVISYFIYFDENDELNNENINNKINNIKTVIETTNNNNRLNNIKNPKKKEVKPVKHNEPLDNVKDGSYKNKKGKQVFNISNNIFNYDEAEAVCKAFNADLADERQIQEAYKKGADWCNYGWSKNQMALYPTQKSSWEQLQKDPANKNSCGMWGVNGGYFENPNTLFGVNCYGVKPEPKDRERNKLPSVSGRAQAIQQKILSIQENINDVSVNPFNKTIWSSK